MESLAFPIYLLLGIGIGVVLSRLFLKAALSGNHISHKDLERQYVSKAIYELKQSDAREIQSRLDQREKELREVLQDLATAEQSLKHLTGQLQNQKQELSAMQKQLHLEFENLANKLLEEKSNKFAKQNEKQIAAILNPLHDKIEGFEKKVNEVYRHEAKERSSLQGEIKSLISLNQRISQEAHNLTQALKGDTKKQGNWGEIILERVLERSGLEKDREYEIQFSDVNNNGRRIQPDVVIHLPEGKHLIIDAKVSLTAYEKFVNEADTARQKEFLKQHLLSFKNHIKGLANKNYSGAQSLRSPDFVLMFVPVESSFSIAVQHDSDLFHYAWERKILIVSPSTLLATLRTVASVWKQEKQTRNALEIARQAGALYDKFAGFVEDMHKIESGIDNMQKAYRGAMNKLQNGQGNLVRRAEKIRALGVKTSKRLSARLLDDDADGQ